MNVAHVIARHFPPTAQAWDARDAALYALSLGYGSDPLDEAALRYAIDDERQQAVPTLAMTLAWPQFWQDDPATGIDWLRILHGEQHVVWHRPLPVAGSVRAMHRLLAVEDKGAGHGALLHFGTELCNAASGHALASIRQVQFLRGDGGCGDWGNAPAPCAPLDAEGKLPQHTMDIPTLPQAALLYRQASHDRMPIHADPATARAAGFARPISHGLNTLGLCARALLRCCAGDRPERLGALSARFVRPALPGDTVRVELFGAGADWRFRAHAVERGALLIDRGVGTLA